MCPRCGRPYAGPEASDHDCGQCLHDRPPFDWARSAGVLEGPLQTLVHALKYRGRLDLAAPLGEYLRWAYWRYWADRTCDGILPVPLHHQRHRQRGFNQAYVLLRRWFRPGPIPAARPVAVPFIRRALIRQKSTPTQAGLGRRARQANVRGAFAVVDRQAVTDRRLLLVDDVFTTGATAIECARVLLESGARRVDVLTLARAM